MTRPARSVLVTGGNTGLGAAAAHELARRGWAVLLTARSPAAGEAAAGRIRAAAPGAQVWALPLDLAELRSVDTLLAQLWASDVPWPPLHALIANAGVQHVSARERTAQGFEGTFGVNHLGHVQLLRGLLAGPLREPGQIVLVGSGTHDGQARHLLPFPPPYDLKAHELADPTRFPQPAGSEVEDARRRYAASKLANTQTAFHLARDLTAAGRRLRVSAFDPGLMPGSGLAREYAPLQRLLWHRALPLLARLAPGSASTVERSGRHLAALLDMPEAQGGGYYVQGGRGAGPRSGHASALARDEARARALWEDSLALLDGVHASPWFSSPR
ncbi:SDR family NAD(P)-dependent oxidoreductase [Deinococcus koreensis]|uniref:Dehydrogenase n=1 Tax=Deinococcus koreensis TaxID=2054903 RepID=A0A2K3UY79_9DEIO|nr:SDR family NAD(P)-dependent oxidoreductase [Deinococcus koreensis]PNY81491.1 hypothetical protein CVO96_08945 [Deinococcus koreensis]